MTVMTNTVPVFRYEKVADKKRLDFIIKSLKESIPSDGSILDVGCGNGIISTHLGLEGYKVLGIDVSEKAIEKAQKHNKLGNVGFRVVSAEQLVASGETYDAIICSEVLEHLDNPSTLLQTLNKSLKENGKLVVTVPNGQGPRETFVTKPILRARAKGDWVWGSIAKAKKILGYQGATVQSDADNLDHVQFFSKKALEKLLTDNQFKAVKFGKSNFIEDVFPFSLLSNRFKAVQKFDCMVADLLPYRFTGGFFSVWEKTKQ